MGQINLFKPDEGERDNKRKKKSFSEEKNLFGATLQNEDKYIRNDFKPKYFSQSTDNYIEALVTNVKVTLLKAGLDKKASEFINRIYKANGVGIYDIISDYVIMVNPLEIPIKKTRKRNA